MGPPKSRSSQLLLFHLSVRLSTSESVMTHYLQSLGHVFIPVFTSMSGPQLPSPFSPFPPFVSCCLWISQL